MDKPADWFELVVDRPGHDVRYAIDASKLRAETGWTPIYRDIPAGLAQTIEWYRQHEQWWKAAKQNPNSRYERRAR
jgi:dTDP-glucose 4,6-dehydratase